MSPELPRSPEELAAMREEERKKLKSGSFLYLVSKGDLRFSVLQSLSEQRSDLNIRLEELSFGSHGRPNIEKGVAVFVPKDKQREFNELAPSLMEHPVYASLVSRRDEGLLGFRANRKRDKQARGAGLSPEILTRMEARRISQEIDELEKMITFEPAGRGTYLAIIDNLEKKLSDLGSSPLTDEELKELTDRIVQESSSRG